MFVPLNGGKPLEVMLYFSVDVHLLSLLSQVRHKGIIIKSYIISYMLICSPVFSFTFKLPVMCFCKNTFLDIL